MSVNGPRTRSREAQRSALGCARGGEQVKRDSLKTAVARIAALRSRSAYRLEKLRLFGELREARQRGEDPKEFLAAQEKQAFIDEAVGRRRS